MNKKYVKKPIPVSAIQWTGENFEEIKAFCTDENGKEMCFINHKDLWIRTREGELKASVRDYLYLCELIFYLQLLIHLLR